MTYCLQKLIFLSSSNQFSNFFPCDFYMRYCEACGAILLWNFVVLWNFLKESKYFSLSLSYSTNPKIHGKDWNNVSSKLRDFKLSFCHGTIYRTCHNICFFYQFNQVILGLLWVFSKVTPSKQLILANMTPEHHYSRFSATLFLKLSFLGVSSIEFHRKKKKKNPDFTWI